MPELARPRKRDVACRTTSAERQTWAGRAGQTGDVILRYESEVRAALTTARQAREVRFLRVDASKTWRYVGEEIRRRWRLTVGKGDYQSLGATLCHVAAQVLGEDPDGEPWN